MKTKLLKRLRKDAKKRYRIKQIGRDYCIWDGDIGCFNYRYRPSLSYKSMTDAKNVCNNIRRDFILCEVNRLRKKKGKFINF